MSASRILVTGGAGFIGSHLVDALMTSGKSVTVLDNLSSGSLDNIRRWLNDPKFNFIDGDLLDHENLRKALSGCEAVYHLAADPEVRRGSIDPELHYRQNVEATFRLLEELRKTDNMKMLIFASSSTVYGEPSKIPTPEDYSPLKPISVYGASKLACEALISSYAHLYGFKAIILRLANIVGPRSHHGVIYDFVNKLMRNPRELEILGDGSQTKSYLYVEDCVRAILLAAESNASEVEIFNIGSEDWVNVKRIAEIIVEEMGLRDVRFKFTGGVDGGRGWPGDVKTMLLDISKLKKLGWKPKYNSEEAVRLAARALIEDLRNVDNSVNAGGDLNPNDEIRKDDVTVIIPTLNEEKAIGEVIRELKSCGYRNILIVDGYSEDRTVEIARSCGAEVIYQVGHGKAAAIKTGFERVKTPFILVMDGDGTYDPRDIERLLRVAVEGDYDEVIGYRKDRKNIPLIHRLGNRIISTLLSLLLGRRIKDPCSGMYLLRKDVAKNLEVTATGFDVEVEIASQVASLGKVAEAPINYRKRVGKSKLKTCRTGSRILLTAVKVAWLYNPVLFFSSIASLFGLAGLIILIWQLYMRYLYGVKAWSQGWAWLGLILLIVGLQAFTITIISLLLKRMERRIIDLHRRR